MRLALCLTLSAYLLASASVTTAQETKQPFDEQLLKSLINDDLETGLEDGRNFLDLKKYVGNFERVTVADVQKAYSKNEIKGNKLYKNKKLLISGTIDEISQDAFGAPYLSFKYKQFVSPRAYFQKSELDSLADLDKGQTVYAFCKVGEYVISSIVFKDCLLGSTVIKNKADKEVYDLALKCMNEKCNNKDGLFLAMYAGLVNDNTTDKEKEILLSSKTSSKEFNAIVQKVMKKKDKPLPVRLAKLGWTKEELQAILNAK